MESPFVATGVTIGATKEKYKYVFFYKKNKEVATIVYCGNLWKNQKIKKWFTKLN